jgi:ABC-2 type transport system permease protein
MHHVRLVWMFIQASFQEEAAYRSNFWIHLLHSLLSLGTGVLGVAILFGQVEEINGWSVDATLALFGVYLTITSLRSLFIGPSLDALAGMDGDVWSGRMDFHLIRPVDIQFLASLRRWRLFSVFDVLLGLGVLGFTMLRLGTALTTFQVMAFIVSLAAGVLILYAILLFFAGMVFWSPGVLFTWVFDGFLQLARYPVGLYPGWLRLVLTWIIPVGMITTIPAQALTGSLQPMMLVASLVISSGLTLLASWFFRRAVWRYKSASS